MFYVAQLHAGHWYVCPYTSTTQRGISHPAADRVYATRERAQTACDQANAEVSAARTKEPK